MARLPTDRVVVITGASSGIGRETALAFARDGARVALGARSEDKLAKVAEEIRVGGGAVLAVATDVTRREDVRRLIRAAHAQWNAVDVLINNAGVGLYAPVDRLTEAELEAQFRVNVFGPLFAIQEALPILRAQGRGQIINISSTLGRVAIPLMGGYSMSKYALEALTESLRIEERPHGIDVILVGPGLTETDFQRNAKVIGLTYNPVRDNKGGVAPQRVARAILRASKRRSRSVYLTAEAKALVAAHGLLPRLTDWGLGLWMRRVLRQGAP